jgi:hypothetical protein
MAVEKEKIKKYVAPVIAVFGVMCAFTIMTYPMLKAMGGMGVPMVATMLTLMPSLIVSIIVYYLNRPNMDCIKTRAAGIAKHLTFAAILSAIIGFLAASVVVWATGSDVSIVELGSFLWLASFALQAVIMGSLNWFRRYGIAIPAAIVLLGMSTVQLPVAQLPAFWQDWIAPWVPQRYMGDGIKEIAGIVGGDLSTATLALAVTAAIGLLLLLTAIARPIVRNKIQRKKEAKE